MLDTLPQTYFVDPNQNLTGLKNLANHTEACMKNNI